MIVQTWARTATSSPKILAVRAPSITQRPVGLIAHKDDAALRAPQLMLEMVQDPPAGAHAAAGDDDRVACQRVDRFGFFWGAGKAQRREIEGVGAVCECLGFFRF
uniref:Uncharacterized protein n=1 Tax=uncultured Acetothermia bacterium TaxID=236499 RepID=H5SC90_9BACT|nr:hypothetical protein HGMM_F08F07C35 [uncultured Acetothermia bacterium]